MNRESCSKEQIAKREFVLLQTIRHWVKLWRTSEVHSTTAMREIEALFDSASKSYD